MTVNRELPVPRPGLPPGKHTARVRAIKRTDRCERQGWLPQRRQSSRDQGSLTAQYADGSRGEERRDPGTGDAPLAAGLQPAKRWLPRAERCSEAGSEPAINRAPRLNVM